MNSTLAKTLCVAGMAVCTMLSGCVAGPYLHVTNQMYNLGQELPKEMVGTHFAGYVAFDEDFVGNYNQQSKNALYVQGIVEGTPEYLLRVARINTRNTDSVFGLLEGKLLIMTGAVVPDHIRPLKAGDIVEIRQTGTWRTMENFISKQEGNIVVRVLCRKADLDYDKCLENRTPRIADVRGVGRTGTPYPATLSEYRFTFTPVYTQDGRPLARTH